MSRQCACGSFAINPNRHGRDAHNTDLCDVCYWRTRAEKAEAQAARYKSALETIAYDYDVPDTAEYFVAREALGGGINEMVA